MKKKMLLVSVLAVSLIGGGCSGGRQKAVTENEE